MALRISTMTDISRLYDKVAADFDRDRGRFIGEQNYLGAIAARLGAGKRVLDLGCGTGEPIARFFIEAGCALTGVDAAPAMIALCRERFPEMNWIEHDMRSLALGERFDVIVAWDSFFHLRPDDQRAMFPVLRDHAAPRGLLLFTSGPDAREAIGDLYGQALYHSSLSGEEYRNLLGEHGFEVVLHKVEDPDCDMHTVWLARNCS